MLVRKSKVGTVITIGDGSIKVTVVEGHSVRLGIEAPKGTVIDHHEPVTKQERPAPFRQLRKNRRDLVPKKGERIDKSGPIGQG